MVQSDDHDSHFGPFAVSFDRRQHQGQQLLAQGQIGKGDRTDKSKMLEVVHFF